MRSSNQQETHYLLRLAQGESHLSLALNRRLGALSDIPEPDLAEGRYTVGQLFAAAEAAGERRQEELDAQAEAKRIAELEALAQRGEAPWDEVDALIQRSQAKPYDEAVRLLVKLKELAVHQRQEAAFQARMAEISDRYQRRYSLIERFHKARLI